MLTVMAAVTCTLVCNKCRLFPLLTAHNIRSKVSSVSTPNSRRYSFESVACFQCWQQTAFVRKCRLFPLPTADDIRSKVSSVSTPYSRRHSFESIVCFHSLEQTTLVREVSSVSTGDSRRRCARQHASFIG
uniref:Uncharacterized protein n=1 Tax=Rhipicephalus pulchellus TaxID=72859 RepID=L7M1X4_RHIPC